jgi:hypothetical protein
MRVSHGESKSRLFSILVGAPQGSVLAAVLFRLHMHFLPQYFSPTVNHLFADDPTIIIKGALEKCLSENIKYIQYQAENVMSSLESFLENYLLPVNVAKNKSYVSSQCSECVKTEIYV